jgi:hypothetical protein
VGSIATDGSESQRKLPFDDGEWLDVDADGHRESDGPTCREQLAWRTGGHVQMKFGPNERITSSTDN